ncbi:YhgE/Pip family protein [Gottfriedia sp. NPDC057991]|uniref:YhgE/Pip family protein n=1 Tax=Gottfriedia sp. NPDC057991 TaxID=3346298 RepID=UPI0036D9EB5E
MNYIHSLKKEFKLFLTNKTLLIMSSIILLIPCLYAGFLVYSYFDPYGRIKNVPLALVNNDLGTRTNGKEIKVGDDLAKELKKSKDLNITEVNSNQVKQALKDNKYYIEIEIPSNFSKNAMSALDSSPEKAQLVYIANEGYNFTAATLGSSVLEKVKEKLGDNVTKAYTKSLLNAQKELSNGMTKLADGSVKIKDGLNGAEDGSKKLSTGLTKFANGTIQFNQGMSKFAAGSSSAANGSTKLLQGSEKFNKGLGKIASGSSELVNGSQTLSDKSTELKNGIEQSLNGTSNLYNKMSQENQSLQEKSSILSQDATNYANQIDQLNQQIGANQSKLNQSIEDLKNTIQKNDYNKQEVIDLLNSFETQLNSENQTLSTQDLINKKESFINQLQVINDEQKSLTKEIGQLKSKQVQLLEGANALTTGQAQLENGMKSLNDGILAGQTGSGQLLAGYRSLSNGLNQLAIGSNNLSTASSKISEGAVKLNDGTAKLANGLGLLNNGAGQLSNGLTTVDKKLNEHQISVDKAASAISNPVSLENMSINHVKTYGDGFAPYGLTLGLYVGLFLFTSVFPLTEMGTSRSGVSWFLGKLTIVFCVGILQAVIVDLLMLLIGVHVEQMTKFFLLSILTSCTFGALFIFIQTAFGHYGRFICMFFLILQLTSSGGTFPIEMLPKFFNHVHSYIPMTYSMLGFKSVISIKDQDVFMNSVTSLLTFLCIGFIISLIYFVYRFNKLTKQVENHTKVQAV